MLCIAAVACSSSSPPPGGSSTGGGSLDGSTRDVETNDSMSTGVSTGGGGASGNGGYGGGAGGASGNDGHGGGGGGASGNGGNGGESSTSTGGGGMGGADVIEDASARIDGAMASDASRDGGADADARIGTGQFDCTMNAGDAMHHVGAEHQGHAVYGVVVDTTAGANRARVGWVQKVVVQADLFVKFVWPQILLSGHTYEIAVFDDMTNSKSCTATDRTWIFPVPKVTGSFVANWITGNQPFSTGTCGDFPMGPLDGP